MRFTSCQMSHNVNLSVQPILCFVPLHCVASTAINPQIGS